jgi:predicted pyridoxine 5'-phosphate oxidase superfamily flavin-nucleotide-binding protein
MSHRFADIAFTPAVKEQQARYGARGRCERLQEAGGPNDALGERERALLTRAESFHLATVSETGWPYVQHRGGPPGFAKVLSATEIAFADFRGNRQYVSVGNAARETRATILVIDYAEGQRLKLLGHLRFTDASAADPALLRKVAPPPDYPARIERVAQFAVAAFDWNCPQHLPKWFSAAQVAAVVQPLCERIDALERRSHDATVATRA